MKKVNESKKVIIGRVSKITAQRINGWAFYRNSELKPTLKLVVNGQVLQTCKADVFRESLKKIHPTGACGFSFRLKKNQALCDDDVVQVFCKKQQIKEKIKPAFDQYYFFIHIPKTAGSSFRNMLYNQFDQKTIYPNLHDITANEERYPTYKDVLATSKNKAREFQFLMGHYPFSTGKILPKSPKYIVFLRDPVKRAISHLYHLKRHGKKELKKASLYEIADVANWQINNLQVRYMSNKNFQPNKLYTKNTDLGKKALKEAKKNIDKCDFVGLTEDFNNSVKRLQKIFDWELGKTLKTNVAPRRHRKVPKDLYKHLVELNQLDIELYEYAKSKSNY